MNNRLASFQECYVSGHQSFSDRLGLPKGAISTLRWFGNTREGYFPLLVVEASPDIWENVKKGICQKTPTLLAVCHLIPKNPAPILIFGTSSNVSDVSTIQFAFSRDYTQFTDLTSDQLKGYFSEINEDFVNNIGLNKEINKSQNDLFQAWTRQSLSRYIVVSDFDAIDTKSKILYELKRIEIPVKQWLPYIDESSQYSGLMAIAKMADYKLVVIAYEERNQNTYGKYYLEKVSKELIKGKKQIIEEGNFESSNRRQVFRSY
jgi:hypothetical protein